MEFFGFEFSFLVLLLAGAIAGGFINGLAGFGTALFTLGFWLQIMPPQQAVALVLTISVVTGIQGFVVVRKAIKWPRVFRFLIPALIGVPLGGFVLAIVDASIIKMVVASFLLIYGAFFAFRKDLPNLQRQTPVLDGFIGFIAGILGGTAGLSGALPTMWNAMRPWPKQEQRGFLQPFNLIILSVAACLLAFDGAFTRETAILILICLPITILSAQIGIWLFRRLEDNQYRRLLISLLLFSGIVLATRELLSFV